MQVLYEIRWPPELPSSKNHLFVSAAETEEANLVQRSSSFVITGSVCFFSLKPLKELSLKISCEVYMKKNNRVCSGGQLGPQVDLYEKGAVS